MFKSTFNALLILLFAIGLSTGAFANQGVTNSVHGKHIGEIVWSNRAVDFRSPDESGFKKVFTANELIYGRVYQKQPLNSYTVYNGDAKQQMRDGAYEMLAYIDGKLIKAKFGVFDSGSFTGKPADHWTTWQFSPRPSDPDSDEQVVAGRWIKAIRRLPPGNHSIRFELWPTLGQYKTKQPIAVGEFTLVFDARDKVTSNAKFPGDVYSGADKASLKQAMKKSLVGPVAKSANEILRVGVRSNWKLGVYKRQTPRLEYRKITGIALWHDTNKDNLCRYTSYNFIQDKKGNNWTPLRFQGFCKGCEEGEIECPN